MDGYLYVGEEIEDYEIAVEAAKGMSSAARFYLSVDAWDIKTLTDKANHAAMLTGTFSCGALSKEPFMVLRGEFQLFSKDPRTPDTDNLVYDFDMVSVFPCLFAADLRRTAKLSIFMATKSSTPQLRLIFARRGRRRRRSMSL